MRRFLPFYVIYFTVQNNRQDYRTLCYLTAVLLQFYVIYFTVQNNRQDYRTLCCLTAVLQWIAELLGVQNGQQLQQKVYLTKNNL